MEKRMEVENDMRRYIRMSKSLEGVALFGNG